MKPTTCLTVLTATTGALALALVGSPARKVINELSGAVKGLLDATRDFKGDIRPIQGKSTELVATLIDGQAEMDKSDNITLAEAATLVHPVKELEHHSMALLKEFKARIEEVKAAHACNLTRTTFGDISARSARLMDTVLYRLKSSFARGTAKPMADEIKKKLIETEELFSEDNCPN
ncbi:hypothetical protein E4U41_006079 [Claviceps citrina]|nr:hypothetical protein E4U41_006079 [Claviceps citrina]